MRRGADRISDRHRAPRHKRREFARILDEPAVLRLFKSHDCLAPETRRSIKMQSCEAKRSARRISIKWISFAEHTKRRTNSLSSNARKEFIMIRLAYVLLISFGLAACTRTDGTQQSLADQCIWNMVGNGCDTSSTGQPSMAAATDAAQKPTDRQ